MTVLLQTLQTTVANTDKECLFAEGFHFCVGERSKIHLDILFDIRLLIISICFFLVLVSVLLILGILRILLRRLTPL